MGRRQQPVERLVVGLLGAVEVDLVDALDAGQEVEVQQRRDGEADLGLPVGVDVVALLHGRPVADGALDHGRHLGAEQLSSCECTAIDRFSTCQ